MARKNWLKVDFQRNEVLRIRWRLGGRSHVIRLASGVLDSAKLEAISAAWALLNVRQPEDSVTAVERVLKFAQTGALHRMAALAYKTLGDLRKDPELVRKSEVHQATADLLGYVDLPRRKLNSKLVLAADPLGVRVSYKSLSFVVGQEDQAEILAALIELLRADELAADPSMLPRVRASIRRLADTGSPDLLFFLCDRLHELDSNNQLPPALQGRWRYFLSKAAEAGSALAIKVQRQLDEMMKDAGIE